MTITNLNRILVDVVIMAFSTYHLFNVGNKGGEKKSYHVILQYFISTTAAYLIYFLKELIV